MKAFAGIISTATLYPKTHIVHASLCPLDGPDQTMSLVGSGRVVSKFHYTDPRTRGLQCIRAEILDPARPAKHWACCSQENSRPPRTTLPVQTSTTNFVCASIFSRPPGCHGPDQTHGQSPYMSRLNGPNGLCRRPARTKAVSRRSGSFGSVRARAGPVGPV